MTSCDDWFSRLLAAFGHVPDTVWAAVIASGITLFGVYLANRNSRAHLRMQIEASEKEAARARLFEMRRNVYLEGAEAIARANSTLGRMADLDLPNTQITQVVLELIARLAKVQAIATPETVQAAVDYLSTFGECQAALWPQRWQLLGRARLIASTEQQLATWVADRDRWMEQIKHANVEGASTARPAIYNGLWLQYNNAESFRAKTAEQLGALWRVQTHEQLEFLDVCLSQTVPMLQVLPTVLTRVRSELELPGDEATFLRILTEAAQRQGTAARELAKKARELAAHQQPAVAPEAPERPPPQPPPAPVGQ